MKTLLLLRHAKSDWSHSGIGDFDRPLNERGRAAAPLMAAEITQRGWLPDLVLVSAAQRTRETWTLVAPHFKNKTPQSELREDLYLATDKTILAQACTLDDTYSSVMIIAHNPGIAIAARRFAAGPQDANGTSALKSLSVKFPTAALAVLQFDVGFWADIAWGAGALRLFLTPRILE